MSQKLSPHSKHRIVASLVFPSFPSRRALHISQLAFDFCPTFIIVVTSIRCCMKKFLCKPFIPSVGITNSFLHKEHGIFSPGCFFAALPVSLRHSRQNV